MNAAGNLPPLPPLHTLVEQLGGLTTKFEEHLERAVSIGMANVTAEDHLVIASLSRALDNVQGIVAMADQKNIFCGKPIIRYQLDTAMTLFGRNLVPNIEEYVLHMMKGEERRKFKIGKQRMDDLFLHTEVTKKYPLMSDLYWDTSGFVHFSRQHLARVIDVDHYKATNHLRFRSHEEIIAGWPDEELRGDLVALVFTSTIILDECEKWEQQRVNPRP